MIFYGWNTSLIKIDDAPKAACSNCGETGHMEMSRYVKYGHIFWLPMFPYATFGMSQCENCDEILYFNEMDLATQEHYAEFKKETRLPWWTFSGSAIILLYIAYLFILDLFQDPTI